MDSGATLTAGDACRREPKPQSIQVPIRMKEYLRGKGRMGDTYADVILREIDRADQYEAAYLALTWDCRDCHVLKEHLCAIGGEMLATVLARVSGLQYEETMAAHPGLIAVDLSGNALVFADDQCRIEDARVVPVQTGRPIEEAGESPAAAPAPDAAVGEEAP